MQVYAVFRVTNLQLVRDRLKESYPDTHYDDASDVFLVASEGETTQQIANKIGLGEDDGRGVSSGIITPTNPYWGRAPSDLWEWIAVKRSANGS